MLRVKFGLRIEPSKTSCCECLEWESWFVRHDFDDDGEQPAATGNDVTLLVAVRCFRLLMQGGHFHFRFYCKTQGMLCMHRMFHL